MSDIVILECRQKSSGSKVIKNGDFETTLNRPVLIEEGDEIAVKSCFIDTKDVSSGKILLETDTELKLTNGLYVQDIDTTDKTYASTDVVYDTKPDGIPYMLCSYTTNGGGPGFTLVSVTVKPVPGSTSWGDCALSIQYRGMDNNIAYTDLVIPPLKDNVSSYTIKSGVQMLNETEFKVLDPNDILEEHHVLFSDSSPSPTIISNQKDTFHPVTLTTTINIPSGSYEPERIAQIITDKLSVSTTQQYVNSNLPVESNFLVTSAHYPIDASNPAGGYALVAADASDIIINYTGTSALYIGTNQVALEYVDGRFQWSSIHMPIYANSFPVVHFQPKGTTGSYFWSGASSGAFFTKLEPAEFWHNTLGFGAELFPSFSYEDKTIHGYDNNFVKTSLTTGVNITNQFLGLDAAVTKGQATPNTPPTTITPPTVPAPPIISTSENSVPIVANTAFADATQVSSAYFLIDIDSKLTQQYISSDFFSKSIQAIVSRYYSVDQYTTGNAESAIPYIHKGEPQLLTSLHCRILDPQTYDSPTIGQDNTVFVELVKAGADKAPKAGKK